MFRTLIVLAAFILFSWICRQLRFWPMV